MVPVWSRCTEAGSQHIRTDDAPCRFSVRVKLHHSLGIATDAAQAVSQRMRSKWEMHRSSVLNCSKTSKMEGCFLLLFMTRIGAMKSILVKPIIAKKNCQQRMSGERSEAVQVSNFSHYWLQHNVLL